jgi:hypothetical protein
MRTALLALALAGCAHVSELPDGSRRVIGLVSMTIPPSIPQEKRGADSLHVTTVGLLVLSGRAASSVQIGYASDRIIAVRNNALVEFFDGREAKGELP